MKLMKPPVSGTADFVWNYGTEIVPIGGAVLVNDSDVDALVVEGWSIVLTVTSEEDSNGS